MQMTDRGETGEIKNALGGAQRRAEGSLSHRSPEQSLLQVHLTVTQNL